MRPSALSTMHVTSSVWPFSLACMAGQSSSGVSRRTGGKTDIAAAWRAMVEWRGASHASCKVALQGNQHKHANLLHDREDNAKEIACGRCVVLHVVSLEGPACVCLISAVSWHTS